MKQTLFLLFSVCVLFRAGHAQSPKNGGADTTGILTVTGIVTHPLRLRAADLATWKRASVRAKDHDGKEYLFSGVALGDILLKAGAPLGAQLHGKQMATYVLVRATDGYEVTFALPELDTGFTDRTILLADEMDGKPLPPGIGPLRIVVPGEKKHARWIRSVTSLVVLRAGADTKTN